MTESNSEKDKNNKIDNSIEKNDKGEKRYTKLSDIPKPKAVKKIIEFTENSRKTIEFTENSEDN